MTQNWLVPIDGSEVALKSVAWIIDHLADWRDVPQIQLINVQPLLPNDIGRFINADTIREFHLESGMKALAAASDRLVAAGITPELHVMVGEAATTITEFAESRGCSQIVLGTRGHSGLTGTLLGSVARAVVHLSKSPVLLVR